MFVTSVYFSSIFSSCLFTPQIQLSSAAILSASSAAMEEAAAALAGTWDGEKRMISK